MSVDDSTRDLTPVLDLGPKASRVAIGDRWGRLVVIGGPLSRMDPTGRFRIIHYPCRCDCGAERAFRHDTLRRGTTHSCGCYAREKASERRKTHGCLPRRLHNIWVSMLARCFNENAQAYPNYGGRGICVCPEWRASFSDFRDWALANGYQSRLTLDRHPDNDGDYGPGNCRWATKIEQANNTRTNHRVEAFGETKTIAEWSNDPRCKVGRACLGYRLKKGCPPEVALLHPPDPGNHLPLSLRRTLDDWRKINT